MRLTHSILPMDKRHSLLWDLVRTDQLSRKIQQAILHTRIKGLGKDRLLQFSLNLYFR